ncbi:MAG TPA: adenylate/guanylate cyclase domain-containing protein [Actinomycetota bacterium]|jgi:class 3 adenylate cyclase
MSTATVTLPSGTVTFVLTDIEDSTGLLQHLGITDYASVLEDHQHLLESAFAARGGVKVETFGDSCLFAFAGATDALTACLDAQLALGAQRSPRDAQVRVRMGLDTGEAKPIQDHYVALPVHKAARIMAAAHGGQVVVSDITRQLVAADLSATLELADLGEYHFKGFATPQRVFQLCHPRLSSEFPPYRAPMVLRNLAAESGSIVGPDRNVPTTAGLLATIRSLRIDDLGRVSKARAASRFGALRRRA